jgi:pyruvate dehydrogenase E2 component (dihydrolipoamide acetyltransferase)
MTRPRVLHVYKDYFPPVMGGIETHRRIPLSLTFDHRCTTGGEACRFLAAVIADLARPD